MQRGRRAEDDGTDGADSSGWLGVVAGAWGALSARWAPQAEMGGREPVELRVRPVEIWAWTAISAAWSCAPEANDYVALRVDEMRMHEEVAHINEQIDVGFSINLYVTEYHVRMWRDAKDDDFEKRKQKGWWWVADRGGGMALEVQEPGSYELTYYVNGGRLTSGVPCGSLRFDVLDPVEEFGISEERVEASLGAVIRAEWTLRTDVGPDFVVVLRVRGLADSEDDGAGDPVVKSVQVRPLTKMSATGVRQGTCEFVVPRAIGHYALLLMGNAAAESGLRRRPLKVVMGVHWRRRPWIKLRNAAGDVDAAVFALGSSLEAEWHFPLAQPDDAICIVGGRYTPRILHKDRIVARIARKVGKVTIKVPEKAGRYCVCLCALHDSGRLLLAASCYLFVEERIAKPDYNKLSRSELVLAEVLEYDQAKRAQQKKDMDLPPEEELEDVHDDGEEGSDETVED